MIKRQVRTGAAVLHIPIEDVYPSVFPDRENDDLSSLISSVRENGILSPLIVREAADGNYITICGERRRRAATEAGFSYLPCILVKADPLKAAVISLAENKEHRNISYIALSKAIADLMKFYKISEISSFLSISQDLVLSYIKLRRLPEDILEILEKNDITLENAVKLTEITDNKAVTGITDIMCRDKCSFEEAKRTYKEERGNIITVFGSDLSLFRNTIKRAADTMNQAGIKAELTEEEDSLSYIYKVKINKLRLSIESHKKERLIRLISGENP